MFGITKIVKGYSIHTYFLYCYAIFISENITRQRGGVTFGTPCITQLITVLFLGVFNYTQPTFMNFLQHEENINVFSHICLSIRCAIVPKQCFNGIDFLTENDNDRASHP